MSARQISDNGTDGTDLGQSATDLIGFYGVTPIARRASANGAAVTATVGSAVDATGATNSSPYGYSQAQAGAIVANINALRVDVLALATLADELRTCLVNLGLHKGGA